MRRASGALLIVLASMMWPAMALGVDGDGETTFTVPLEGGKGLSVKFEADDDEIELTVRKQGMVQFAIYSAPGEVSPERVAVDFGRFGEFVADYEPFRTLETRKPGRHCVGEPSTRMEGFFRGTIRLRGERGYFHVEATRVKGTLAHVPERECDYPWEDDLQVRGRRAIEEQKAEATLAASSPKKSIRFAAVGSHLDGERPFNSFYALGFERREGVSVIRYTFARSRTAGFEFDHDSGTARVDPPAPFAGSARYVDRPNVRERWRGSLTAPLLGLGRVHLAGSGFRANLVPRTPEFR
jgi:hypothetical protein